MLLTRRQIGPYDCCPLDELEHMVAAHYVVYPVDSKRSFQIAEDPEGNVWRAIHVNFSVSFDGNIHDACAYILGDIKKLMPVGSVVVWRRRPYLTVMGDRSTIVCRLGCFERAYQDAAAGEAR